jgi:peroxiredoxin
MSAIGDSPQKDAVVTALKDAGGNWRELADAVCSFRDKPRELAGALWVVSNVAHIDRLELDSQTLRGHVEGACAVRTDFVPDLTDETFRSFVLDPRVGPYEHISAWRAAVSEEMSGLRVKGDVKATALAVNKWVEKNIQTYEHERLGPALDPLMVLKCKRADDLACCVFTAAALRSVGIPARIAQSRSWVEFLVGSDWLPLYPRDSANFANVKKDDGSAVAYAKPGTVLVNLKKRGRPAPESVMEQLSVSRWTDGTWLPWDEAPGSYENGTAKLELPAGTYLFQAVARNRNGDPRVFFKELVVATGKTIEFTVDLDMPFSELGDEDRVVRKIEKLPEASLELLAGGTASLQGYLKNGAVVLAFFAAGDEPSERMLPLLAKVATDGKVQFVAVHSGKADIERLRKYLGDSSLTMPVMLDESGAFSKEFELPFDEKGGKFTAMPAVLVISREGKVVFWDEGYNLNIGAQVEAALELVR